MIKAVLKAGVAAAILVGGAGAANAVVIYYQQGFSNNLFKYDTVANVETLVGNLGLGADSTGLAFAPNGTLYAMERASQSLYTVNTTTGAATLVGNSGIDAEDLTISQDGSQGFASSNGVLYSVNLSTGAATRIGPTVNQDGLTTARGAVTVNNVNYAAGSVFGVDTGTVYAINTTTGAATNIGATAGANETFDFGPDNVLYGHNSNGQLFTINLTTFAATPIFNTTPTLVFGMAVAPGAAVPEPAAWALMIAGFGLAGAAFRTRRTRVTYA